MITKKIKYEDYFGSPREDTYFFHLSKPELVNLGFKLGGKDAKEGDFEALIAAIAATEDRQAVIAMVEDVILKSYCVPKNEGRGIEKSEELKNDFYHSAAYESLFEELLGNQDKLMDFIVGVMPKDMQGEVIKSVKDRTDKLTVVK